jgi:hypothetical protein
MSQGRALTDANGQIRLPKWRPVKQLDLVGTAEAADILGVERPRIGRWIKRGVMPPTATDLKATPVWYRRDVLKMHDWVEANRRYRSEPDAEPEPEPVAEQAE